MYLQRKHQQGLRLHSFSVRFEVSVILPTPTRKCLLMNEREQELDLLLLLDHPNSFVHLGFTLVTVPVPLLHVFQRLLAEVSFYFGFGLLVFNLFLRYRLV